MFTRSTAEARSGITIHLERFFALPVNLDQEAQIRGREPAEIGKHRRHIGGTNAEPLCQRG